MKAEFPVDFLVARLGVSESGYYRWLSAPALSPRKAAQWDLSAKVLGRFVASDGVAGHRKIHADLLEAGIRVDRKTVGARMRELHLVPKQTVRAWKKAAARQRLAPDPADLVERSFSTSVAPGSVLVGDVTYVHTGQGWLYVATVIDLASRTVLGSASSKRIDTSLIIRALKNAIDTGHVAENAIFHTDHGANYRSRRFRKYCRTHDIRQSMGSKFECWDNAVAESFFSQLKQERLHAQKFATRAQAETAVREYVRYYNTWRPHGTIGGITPAAHRATYDAAA